MKKIIICSIILFGYPAFCAEPKAQKERKNLFSGGGVRSKGFAPNIEEKSQVKIGVRLKDSFEYEYDFSLLKNKSIDQEQIKSEVQRCGFKITSSAKKLDFNEFEIFFFSKEDKVFNVEYSSTTIVGRAFKECLVSGLKAKFISALAN